MEVYARAADPAARARAPGCALTAFVNREAAAERPRRRAGASCCRSTREQPRASGCAASSSTSRAPRPRGLRRACTRSPRPRRCAAAPPRVTTIHDLNYKLVPDTHFGVRGLGMRVLVPAAARRSHRVIAISESTRDDLVEPPPRRPPAQDRRGAARASRRAAGRGRRRRRELRARLGLGDRPVRAQRERQAPAQEPRAAARRARPDPAGAAPGARRPRLPDALRGRAARARAHARASTATSSGRRGCPTPTSRACTRSPRCVVVPVALRGLRAAGARGDGARRARRLLGPLVAARGRRRRRAAVRPGGHRARSARRSSGCSPTTTLRADLRACAAASRPRAFTWERTARADRSPPTSAPCPSARRPPATCAQRVLEAQPLGVGGEPPARPLAQRPAARRARAGSRPPGRPARRSPRRRR